MARVVTARVVSLTSLLLKNTSRTFLIRGSASAAMRERANEPEKADIVLTTMMIIAKMRKIWIP